MVYFLLLSFVKLSLAEATDTKGSYLNAAEQNRLGALRAGQQIRELEKKLDDLEKEPEENQKLIEETETKIKAQKAELAKQLGERGSNFLKADKASIGEPGPNPLANFGRGGNAYGTGARQTSGGGFTNYERGVGQLSAGTSTPSAPTTTSADVISQLPSTSTAARYNLPQVGTSAPSYATSPSYYSNYGSGSGYSSGSYAPSYSGGSYGRSGGLFSGFRPFGGRFRRSR